jgi:archaeosine synthase
VLDLKASDGRGRAMEWTPQPGASVRTPGLVFPETSFATPPAWIQCVVTAKPTGRKGTVEIASGGTWFYPLEQKGDLTIPAPKPAPTTVVQTLPVGPELSVFHDAGGWARNPKSMVAALMQARREATPGRLLWAPALGTPDDYALWVYLGVDLFDASPLLLAAVRGQALTVDGALSAADAARVVGGATDGKAWDTERLVTHNLEAARAELELIRHHITAGTLRSLVERRIYTKAASVELLRRFDREHAYLEAATPHFRANAMPAMTQEALWMPEVEGFRRRVRDGYQPPKSAKVLVLLPCSQKKPYKISRSHRAFARVLDESGIRPILHEVMVTSPLGLVPRDIEEAYPANQYDIPVTGHWLRDEEAVVKEQLAALLDKQQYDHVIVHMGQATFDVLRHLLPENVRHTCLHHPTSQEDLKRLAEELARLKGLVGPVDAWAVGKSRKLEDIRALATFQFGAAVGEALVADAHTHGRMPFLKLERRDGVQLGMTTPDRGVLSLTLEGAKVLAAHQTKRVFIQDFPMRKTSSLFAVGVTSADPDIRAGDEVVVLCGDEVRGSGTAQMSAEEMTHLRRGIAVTLRHHAEAKVAAASPKEPEASKPMVLEGGA